MSTFASIELGKRSLFAHRQSTQTAGHNISNSSTPGYTRQRVNLDAFEPIYRPDLSRAETPGQIGQGVTIGSITRLRDELLDQRIVASTDELGYWQTRDSYLTLLEQVHNEPEDISVRTRMDQFWEAWQELSLYPESDAARQVVRTRSETLTDSIHHQYRALQEIRDMVHGDIEATVKQVNDLTGRIAALNEEIVKVKAMGDNPNDLMDKRDVLTEKLSNLIDISVDKRDEDETYVIHTAGLEIVQGSTHRTFDLKASIGNDNYADVVWSDSGNLAHFEAGKLAALIELRDTDIRDEIRKLDTMAMNFVDLVNDVHRNAMTPNGKTGIDFFKEQYFINNTLGNFDANGDGEYDSSYIFRITGKNTLDPREQIGLEGTLTLSSGEGTVQIPYKSTDMVSELIERINRSGAEVVSYLDQNNKLVLKGTTSLNKENPDFVIRHIEDSGRFLAGYSGVLSASGEEGAYDWGRANAVDVLDGAQFAVSPIAHPSGWLEMNPVIKSDIQNIAAGYRGPEGTAYPGDNRAALAIAAIRNTPVMVGNSKTFDEFFADTVTEIGLKGEQAEMMLNTQTAIVKELHDMRDSVSGVNIDEELSDIIKFQHGYNASARFISVANEMLDTVINRMGV
ncbi:flagellar hook-associated protein FlgK [Treponema pedis]|uniref:flagellar hook-associated protein FlgK n=1 Tax=Treponema pedis TaxID=409322 RepID=UPI00041C628C|nr:flagellar hook-associated protein FlgK [Treponema pedis]QSI03899.1 flagellar hook-associated protein FlgK [Treponema pedis]